MNLKELIAKQPMLQNVLCGVQVLDGWCNLIDKLCTVIEHRNYNGRSGVEATEFRVEQVKEKFGGLRFYVSGADDFINGAIELAEDLSFTICEVCGNPGEANEEGWIKVRCQECVKCSL
jgi:hypothetical protein